MTQTIIKTNNTTISVYADYGSRKQWKYDAIVQQVSSAKVLEYFLENIANDGSISNHNQDCFNYVLDCTRDGFVWEITEGNGSPDLGLGTFSKYFRTKKEAIAAAQSLRC